MLDLSILKAFADSDITLTLKFRFPLGRAENISGKGENAGYQHFLLFPKYFLKCGSSKVFKSLG